MSYIDLIASSPAQALLKALSQTVLGISIGVDTNEDLSKVRAETERQENEMQRAEAQAKVAQEMAIAGRIERAATVEIEEYFEYFGEGKAGLNVESKAAVLGLSGSGKRISKRVLRFSGTVSAEQQDQPGEDGDEAASLIAAGEAATSGGEQS